MTIFSRQPNRPYMIARDYQPYINFAWVPGLPIGQINSQLYGTYSGFGAERSLNCVASGYGGTGIRVYNFPVSFSPWTVIARVRAWTNSSGTGYPGTLLNRSNADIGIGWNYFSGALGIQYGSGASYSAGPNSSYVRVPYNSNKPTNISYQFNTSTFEQYSSNGIFIKNAVPYEYAVNFSGGTVDIGWMGGQSGKTFELLGLIAGSSIMPDTLVEYATGENFWGMFSPVSDRRIYVQLSADEQPPLVTSAAGDASWFGGGL